jgi:hypothetical protein
VTQPKDENEAILKVRRMCEAMLAGRHVEGALADGDEGPWLARKVLTALGFSPASTDTEEAHRG